MVHTGKAVGLAISLLWSAAAAAATYDEAIHGDLSGNPAAPTPWTLTAGANILTGQAGNRLGDDYDLVSFTVPAGHQLNRIAIKSFQVDDNYAFLGLQFGTPWNDGLGYDMLGEHLWGFALLDTNPAITDILDLMILTSSVPNASKPLPAGVYTLELQDVDDKFRYSLSLNVTPVGPLTPGDFNGDGKVDRDDLAAWKVDFDIESANSDADGDKDSDGNDLLIWQRHVGVGGAATAAPEPTCTALALAAIPVAGFLLRRRR
jgi:hypothetical protein